MWDWTRLRVTLFGAAVLYAAVMAQAADPARVAILYPSAETYQQSVDQIHQVLLQRGHTCKAIGFGVPGTGSAASSTTRAADTAADEERAGAAADTGQILEQLRAFRPALIVAVGHNATILALRAQDEVPVVACAVPNALDRLAAVLGSPAQARLTVVPMEVSPEAQMEWIHQSSPNTKRLGVLYGDKTKHTAEALVKPAQERGITVCRIHADKDAFRDALQEMDKQNCDGALMLGDATVYNAASAQAMLLWGLRGRRPVWTFSTNLVKSGGFAGIAPETGDIGAQVAELVERIVRGERPGESGLQYPRMLLRAVNEHTAELIGLKLGSKLSEGVKRLGKG